jgi:hypothetical protein
MAQTGYTPISIYYSATASNTPTAGNLVAGELAINTADGKLFYKDSAGVVQVIGTKGGVGSSTTTQVLYNSSGLVVGSANMTFNGTSLTLANDASISGLTVGKGGGSAANTTAVGYQAFNAVDTGSYSSAVGYQAGYSQTSGARNNYLGWRAGYANTSGTDNSFVGHNAGVANTTGVNSTAIGSGALFSNTTASNNTAVGYQAGYSNTTGTRMTTIGGLAGSTNSTGNYCVYVGYAAGQASTGSGNTFVGDSAGSACTGSNNVFVGPNNASAACGSAVTTGSKNTILGGYSGNQGGLDIRTASNYIVLSDGDGNPRMTYNATGVPLFTQNTITSKAAAATLTGAEVLALILNTTGTTYTITLPTGTNLDTATGGMGTGTAFDWTVINTASGTITIAANGNTTLGTLTIATGVSAQFRFLKTAANTFTVYRIS